MNEIYSFKISKKFGAYCVNGSESLTFLRDTLMPMLRDKYQIALDFEGVLVMNSSFSNALFGNLFQSLGRKALDQIVILGASPVIKNEIKSGIAYGINLSESVAAA
jgi:hypothetical protein